MKHNLSTLLFALMTATLSAQTLAGDWKGTLEVQGIQLEIIFHLTQNEDLTFSTTMDVPMQGAAGIPMDNTELTANGITIESRQMGIKYAADLREGKMQGEWNQGGMSFPLVMEPFESKLPGDTSLPSSDEEIQALIAKDKGDFKYRVEDYFAKPKASSFQISPNGKYLSYREKDERNKRHVYVKETATGKVTKVVEEGEELIRGYGWINDNRMIYVMDRGGDENYHIYGVDINGKNLLDLTPFDGVKASILNPLKDQPDYIIVSLNKTNPQVFEPYKLNVTNGDLELLYKNDDPANPIQGYDFDKDGNLRAFSKMKDGVKQELYYKTNKSKEFEKFITMDWDDSFGIAGFNYAPGKEDIHYVTTNLDSDKARIVLYDFANKKVVEEVFSHPDFDAQGMARSRKRNYEIDYFSYEGDKYVLVPVSSFYKDLESRMKKEFGNRETYVAGADDNETKFLILVQSDRLYGTYYEYDAKTKKFTLLYDLMPNLKEDDMAEMRPISFKSRDGLTIHGYITLPKAALEGKKVPLIVNPHGGPQGVRDSWGFNPEAQLFAGRGWATLQVNFRISGGYGKEFLRAGFKQIGRKLMDDVEDGVAYAIEQGWVDKDRIAIYGGSHGGYATLMGMIKTPEIYRCGVNYVGVSNIFTFFESFPEYWKPYKDIVKQIWYDLDDPSEAEIAKQVSPVFQIEKIKSPLFVVQGANDPRVKIAESDQIVSALRAKGYTVPYLVKYDEGHGFGKEENQIEFYRAMMGFLSENLR